MGKAIRDAIKEQYQWEKLLEYFPGIKQLLQSLIKQGYDEGYEAGLEAGKKSINFVALKNSQGLCKWEKD